MADRAFLERLSRELADQGRLIEAGWVGYRLMVMSPTAPPIQLDECRLAFMAGSQHLFSSLMNILDPGAEPTDADLRKMDLIELELLKFAEEFELRAVRTKGSA
jgi:hypothetical protein